MNPVLGRGVIALTIILGTACLMLALLLRKYLSYTRTGKLQLGLAAVISIFVTQHAMLLFMDPAPHILELSRTVLLVAMAVVVGLALYDRHATAREVSPDG